VVRELLILGVVAGGCRPPLRVHPSIVLSERRVEALGHRWALRAGSSELTGPGPSPWADDPGAVTGGPDRLCLSLAPHPDGTLRGAEVVLPLRRHARVTVDLALGPAPLHHVAAVFLYRHDDDEVDVEWSRWGDPTRPPLQLVVVPATPGRQLQLAGARPHRVQLWQRRHAVVVTTWSTAGRTRWRRVLTREERRSRRGPWALHANIWPLPGAPTDTRGTLCLHALTTRGDVGPSLAESFRGGRTRGDDP